MAQSNFILLEAFRLFAKEHQFKSFAPFPVSATVGKVRENNRLICARVKESVAELLRLHHSSSSRDSTSIARAHTHVNTGFATNLFARARERYLHSNYVSKCQANFNSALKSQTQVVALERDTYFSLAECVCSRTAFVWTLVGWHSFFASYDLVCMSCSICAHDLFIKTRGWVDYKKSDFKSFKFGI